MAVHQYLAGLRIEDRPLAHRIAQHTVGVPVFGHGHGAQVRGLLWPAPLLQISGLAVEIRFLHLEPLQPGFVEVVFGFQVDIQQAQAHLQPPCTGLGLDAHRGHARLEE